jgi:hypothetical protein
MVRRRSLPVVRVVSGVDSHQAFRSRLQSAVRTARPAVRGAIEVAVGVWPLWAVCAFAIGLVWAFALGQSP